MMKFYVTRQFFDKDKKLIKANQEIIVSEERVDNLVAKGFGYVIGKAEIKKEENRKNKNLIGKK